LRDKGGKKGGEVKLVKRRIGKKKLRERDQHFSKGRKELRSGKSSRKARKFGRTTLSLVGSHKKLTEEKRGEEGEVYSSVR